ncbi:MAG: putative inorganic carbon transporter subunit DabA, partial [Anderseniella sp.]|nr:putative inorganic carbon transporter subunit DabA [Anderseniella sp.]
AQRRLAGTLCEPAAAKHDERPALQAAFCIDVRSEVFRRALEQVDPSIRTLGFAGFFGVFASHKRFASDVAEHRLPVLLNPAVSSCSGGRTHEAKDFAARYKARAKRAWGRFKLAAVSSFAFVEAMGPVYAGKLVRDGLALRHNKAPNDPAPKFAPELDLETRVNSAETVLRAMSLTDGFARIVMLAGHGASVVNNPHASGLHCGACGGYSGEVNARLLAQLLNDPQVREGLAPRGISVPQDTLFVAALHDTTTDAVTLYDQDVEAKAHQQDLRQVHGWLAAAGRLARGERALRLPRAGSGGQGIERRARDWAEVRPEWALAGCKAFIAAPRTRTSGRSLEGRAFLHDYDWHRDSGNGFKVLELIMTAPVVVASWISLQYYGSTVAPAAFGGGNKLLHNVVGGIGVLEGNGGLMRGGLPWQSVHDGDKQIHEPLRLSVCIEAPREAMTDILTRHPGVRELFDNKWLHLFAMDEAGMLAWRYEGNLSWSLFEQAEQAGGSRHKEAA